jgi:hypothetical protein
VSTAVRWAFVLLVAAHGIAHLPGFAVSWRLMSSPEVPYHTTLLHGRWDVGATGIRIVGLLWLLAGGALLAGAALLMTRWPWALVLVGAAAAGSLFLSIVEWPFARIGVGVNIVVLLVLPIAAAAFWRADSARLIDALSAAPPTAGAGNPASVPPVVARYLQRAAPEGRTASHVRLEQHAEFMLGGTWRPLTAEQFMQASPPAFVWDARIAMAPGVAAHVRDSYGQGHGGMHASAMGIVPMVAQQGRPELDAGALHRYLAELVWLPSALRPGSAVRWEPIGEREARVTLVDGANTVSLEFRFNGDGDVEEIFTPARYSEKDGHYSLQPWQVRCREHTVLSGFRVPGYCEVAWLNADGPAPYWRGRISAARYTLADPPTPPASPAAPR